MANGDPPSFFSKITTEIGNWGKLFGDIGEETSSWFKTPKPTKHL